jgi:phage gp29-like protein
VETVTLFDANGRLVNFESLRQEKAGPTLTGIRQPLSDHPSQGLTPVKLARILLAAEQGLADSYLELAEEMEEKDLHYHAVISSRKMAVSGLPINVESASDNPEDKKAAELVEDFLTRDELKSELFHILDAIAKGYSVTEIIWETSENQWMPLRLEFRDPTFFEFDRLGQKLLLRTNDGPKPLDPYKFIVHQTIAKSGLAIRGGLARAAAWAYMFKNFTIKSWAMFLEVFGMPLRVGKYGAAASAEEKATLLRAVRDMASDAGCIIPDNMAIEFVTGTASGQGPNSYFTNADYWDKQISKLVLGQTGTTDTGQYVGTSEAHQATQNDIEVSDAVQLAATLNRDLIRPMIDLNMGPRKGRLYPRLRIAREQREDLAALGNLINQFVPLGLEVQESVIRDKLGLPEPEQGSKLLSAPAQPGMMMPGSFGGVDTPAPASAAEPSPVPETTPAAEPAPTSSTAPVADQPNQGEAEVEAVSPTASLNGAQVTALMQVIQQVVVGALPRNSGIGILTAAFGLTDHQAEAIMGEAGKGFVPANTEDVASNNTASVKTSAPISTQNPIPSAVEPEPEQNSANVEMAIEGEKSALSYQDILGPAMGQIMELAENSSSHDEFKAGILELAKNGSLDLDALGDDLASKMFKASLSGVGVK